MGRAADVGPWTWINNEASSKYGIFLAELRNYKTPKQKGISMNQALGIALLVVGIVLIIFGINASDSFSSDVSRFFTGSPTNKAMWLLIGGIASAIVGFFIMIRGSAAK